MARTKVEFVNAAGTTLSGLLELPDPPATPQAFALFAHCFTCGKDVKAASRIARALAAHRIAVLRFDFTGLGNSDGDFANTNFSSNVEDLVAAANFLGENYQAPKLLIGHSLGGAAVLVAAHRLAAVEAIATIGAPATAAHVQHLFAAREAEIRTEGCAIVDIGGRRFSIKSQLLDDLAAQADADHIGALRRPLIVFHSPVDTVVDVNEAAIIFAAAKHPKSFVSLDQADHMLSRNEDSEFVAGTLAAWAGRYLNMDVAAFEPSHGTAPPVAEHSVLVTELNRKFLRGLYSHTHQGLADEPLANGGSNLGPDPYELLLMSLGACTSMTLRMYANHKKLPISDIQVSLRYQRVHGEDCAACEEQGKGLERITREIRYTGTLDEQQTTRFLAIADRCPVHRTLTGRLTIDTVPG